MILFPNETRVVGTNIVRRIVFRRILKLSHNKRKGDYFSIFNFLLLGGEYINLRMIFMLTCRQLIGIMV